MSSSRRTSGEIHILAMLDGKATGPLSRRFLALPAVFWYGAAGLGVCVVLATLAWLAHTLAPAPGRDAGAAAAADAGAGAGEVTVHMIPPASPSTSTSTSTPARHASAPLDAADHAVLVVTDEPPSGSDAPPPLAHGATIVDLPQTSSTPVVLPAIRTVPTTPAPSTHLPDLRSASAAPGRAHGPHAASATIRPIRAQPPARTAPHATALKTAAAHPPTPRRPPATPAGATPRSRRQAAPATVDTDVALISAIIQHTAPPPDPPEPGAATPCTARACGPRMPNR